MKTILNNDHGMALAVLTMLITILASMTGAALLFSRVDLMISSNFKRGTGALYAADAGVGEALNQLSGNLAASKVQIPSTGAARQIGDYSYRSGNRTDSGPQPIHHTGFNNAPGYSMNAGTGYNPGGYIFHTYEIHMTGLGPLNSSAREIEALGQYGPVPN